MDAWYYVDYPSHWPVGKKSEVWERMHIKKRRAFCQLGCSGVNPRFSGQPFRVLYEQSPITPFDPSIVASSYHVSLWNILKNYIPNAIVGDCALSMGNNHECKLNEYVSFYTPVSTRCCVRHDATYFICTECGYVRAEAGGGEKYVLMSDVNDKDVVVTMRRGILVSENVRMQISNSGIELQYVPYRIRETPLDGRPVSLDDWPELKMLRSRARGVSGQA